MFMYPCTPSLLQIYIILNSDVRTDVYGSYGYIQVGQYIHLLQHLKFSL